MVTDSWLWYEIVESRALTFLILITEVIILKIRPRDQNTMGVITTRTCSWDKPTAGADSCIILSSRSNILWPKSWDQNPESWIRNQRSLSWGHYPDIRFLSSLTWEQIPDIDVLDIYVLLQNSHTPPYRCALYVAHRVENVPVLNGWK